MRAVGHTTQRILAAGCLLALAGWPFACTLGSAGTGPSEGDGQGGAGSGASASTGETAGSGGGATSGGGGATGEGGSGNEGGGGGSAFCDVAGGEIEDPATHHCYLLVATAVNRDTALTSCRNLGNGSDLAAISTPAERAFLESNIEPSVWIGGGDAGAECDFKWSNGEPWIHFWDSGEPNDLSNGELEDCVELRGDGRYNDLQCSSSLQFLCERVPPGRCGDKIVQPGEECDDGNEAATDGCDQCQIKCRDDEFKDPESLHCYHVSDDTDDWDDARAICASLGAHLAIISSTVELELLKPHVTADTWIGASGSGFFGIFSWQNGEPGCFANWASGQPSGGVGEDCIEMFPNGTWDNDGCSQNKRFICEREPLWADPTQ